MTDLFGDDHAPASKPKKMANGYAAPPGFGPNGETCRSCRYSEKVYGGAKSYWKCALVKHTSCIATDIRLKSPACRRWEEISR